MYPPNTLKDPKLKVDSYRKEWYPEAEAPPTIGTALSPSPGYRMLTDTKLTQPSSIDRCHI
jgi:hypothetical protein